MSGRQNLLVESLKVLSTNSDSVTVQGGAHIKGNLKIDGLLLSNFSNVPTSSSDCSTNTSCNDCSSNNSSCNDSNNTSCNIGTIVRIVADQSIADIYWTSTNNEILPSTLNGKRYLVYCSEWNEVNNAWWLEYISSESNIHKFKAWAYYYNGTYSMRMPRLNRTMDLTQNVGFLKEYNECAIANVSTGTGMYFDNNNKILLSSDVIIKGDLHVDGLIHNTSMNNYSSSSSSSSSNSSSNNTTNNTTNNTCESIISSNSMQIISPTSSVTEITLTDCYGSANLQNPSSNYYGLKKIIIVVDKNSNTQISPYKIISNSLANGSGLLLDTVGQSVELLWTTKNKWFVIGGTGCSLLPPN
tara:strand:- start:581 stop:1648 length:1068 start_codon:yes stop_codon:yes gene_type:complete